jgi:hypothetical protein
VRKAVASSRLASGEKNLSCHDHTLARRSILIARCNGREVLRFAQDDTVLRRCDLADMVAACGAPTQNASQKKLLG